VDPAPEDTAHLGSQRQRRLVGLVLVLAALVAMVLVSIMFGSKPVPLGHVIDAFTSYDGSGDDVIVRDQRVPRTVLALVVGAALGVAGALMQGLTRNPLADPGLLGVSAGSAFAMTLAVAFLSISSSVGYIWFSFVGAVVATVVVYLLGTAGRMGGSPITLALAGVSIGAVLAGLTETITLLDEQSFLAMRVWDAGGLANRGWDIIGTITPFIVVGLLLAAFAARGLNAVALGDDLATSLGANQRRTRIVVIVSVTLLCGAATAAVGPIWFIGLMVPHAARWIVGPDQRWILAYTVLLAPVLMLSSDVLGRLLVRPDELEAGLVTAFIGGPVLIWLIRRASVRAL
jgi:iron complex transport system permease protein